MAQKPLSVRLLEDEFVCECYYLDDFNEVTYEYEGTYARLLEKQLAQKDAKVKVLERKPHAKA